MIISYFWEAYNVCYVLKLYDVCTLLKKFFGVSVGLVQLTRGERATTRRQFTFFALSPQEPLVLI